MWEITQTSSECLHKCPRKKEAVGDLTHVQKRKQGGGGDRNSSDVATSLRMLATFGAVRGQDQILPFSLWEAERVWILRPFSVWQKILRTHALWLRFLLLA